MEDFVKTHLCKLRGILRSRVLRVLSAVCVCPEPTIYKPRTMTDVVHQNYPKVIGRITAFITQIKDFHAILRFSPEYPSRFSIRTMQ